MAEQVRKTKTAAPVKQEETEKVDPAKADTKLKDELDDLLDEIDSVLEVNAEEFVKNYVQKGGE